MSDRPTLRTLANVLFQAGCQAELLRLIYHEPGRTSEVVEAIALDIQFCAERLEDEIKALEKWGESGDAA